jgi:hypothetical protein
MKTNKALDVHETERKSSNDTLFLGHKLDQLPGTARDAAKKSFLILMLQMHDAEGARGAPHMQTLSKHMQCSKK